MATIIVETKVEECHKFDHKHGNISGLLQGLLYSSNYCPECGEYLKEQRPVTTRKCSVCGALLLPAYLGFEYKFCPNCGVNFE